MIDIRRVEPTEPLLAPLIARHLELMYASSPACSVHAMDAASMMEAGVRFVAAFENGEAVAMGALKRLSGANGELKSMHVRSDHRGSGYADAILRHLLEEALAAGLSQVSLETGSQDAFIPARAFYSRHGFTVCPPFEGYEEDPNSIFMTRSLI